MNLPGGCCHVSEGARTLTRVSLTPNSCAYSKMPLPWNDQICTLQLKTEMVIMHFFVNRQMNCSLSKYLPTASSVLIVYLFSSARIYSESLVKQLVAYFSAIREPKIATFSDFLAGKYSYETRLETNLVACKSQVSQQFNLIQNLPESVLSELYFIVRMSNIIPTHSNVSVLKNTRRLSVLVSLNIAQFHRLFAFNLESFHLIVWDVVLVFSLCPSWPPSPFSNLGC